MPANPADRIKFACSCGKRLAVAASAAGRKVKCPACGEVLRVPQAPTTGARVPSAPKASNTSLLEELAQQEKAARPLTPAAPRTAGSECPNCRSALPVGAVLCVACGYNTKTGQKVKMGGATSGRSIGSLAAAVAGRNSFLFGCLLGGIGAFVGAGIWSAAAMASGYEIGWIAWGVGGLAGFGMAKGYGQPTQLAGAAAAALAIGGIFLAKVFILVFVLDVDVTGDTIIAMFGVIDAVFILLAVVTAYRLASAGSDGED